jgi:hypothetical protein
MEHYVASQSYAHTEGEFNETYPISPVQQNITPSRLVDELSDSESVNDTHGLHDFGITLYWTI